MDKTCAYLDYLLLLSTMLDKPESNYSLKNSVLALFSYWLNLATVEFILWPHQ